jgi:predicted phosphodiesterase
VPTLEVQNRITMFNPGALSKHGKGSYGLIEIDNGNINAKFKEI